MKWSALEQQKREELTHSKQKSRLVSFCIMCAIVCTVLLCVTFTAFCLRL